MYEVKYFGIVLPVKTEVDWQGDKVPVLMEMQCVAEERQINREAAEAGAENKDLVESTNRVARAILKVNQDTVTEDLSGRLEWGDTWPEPLLDELSAAYWDARQRIRKERAVLDADPNSERPRETNGSSSVTSDGSGTAA